MHASKPELRIVPAPITQGEGRAAIESRRKRKRAIPLEKGRAAALSNRRTTHLRRIDWGESEKFSVRRSSAPDHARGG